MPIPLPLLPASSLQIYKRLLQGLRPYFIFFMVGIVCTALVSIIDSGLAWTIKPIINQGLINRDPVFIKMLPLAIILIFIVRGVVVFFSGYCIQTVGRSIIRDFRQQIFYHILHLPASFYDTASSGELLSSIIYNVEQIAEASTSALLLIVQESILAIGLVVVMFLLSWKLTVFFVVVFPFMLWLSRFISRRIRSLSVNVQKSIAEVSHIAEESIEGYRVIRTFGGEDYEYKKFITATEHNRQQELKIVTTNACGTAAVQVIISIAIAATLLVATLPAMAVSAGAFAALITAMFTLLRPIRRINQTNSIIQKGLAGAQSIFELLDKPIEKDTGTLNLIRTKGAIEYQQVSFSYPNTDTVILNNIGFKVEPGETIALVGHSGSGKSTLLSLLPRFYDIHQGQILIDNTPITAFQLADLRNQFALVSQQVTLFNDTIAHNIGYGSCFKEEAILKAAEAAYAMEFIQYFPNKLQTIIGENGVLLSGGQRQRIAIARALLKDAPILILDEATSALDTQSEFEIQTALAGLMKNRTTLVIAHRLSTIKNADRILVLEKGKIIEMGTHTDLIKKNGYYAKLYYLQFKD